MISRLINRYFSRPYFLRHSVQSTLAQIWPMYKLIAQKKKNETLNTVNGTQWQTLNAQALQCYVMLRCPGTSAGFWLGGSMPPCRLRQNFFRKFDEMVHSEVYLNKCGQHSAVLYTCLPWLLSKYNINIENCSFCMFSLYNFSSIFPWGSADPICPYVRTPMPLLPVTGKTAVHCFFLTCSVCLENWHANLRW